MGRKSSINFTKVSLKECLKEGDLLCQRLILQTQERIFIIW